MFFEMRDPFFLYKKWPEQSKLVLFINGRQQIPCLLLEKKGCSLWSPYLQLSVLSHAKILFETL